MRRSAIAVAARALGLAALFAAKIHSCPDPVGAAVTPIAGTYDAEFHSVLKKERCLGPSRMMLPVLG